MLVKQQLGLAVGKMITEELNCNSSSDELLFFFQLSCVASRTNNVL